MHRPNRVEFNARTQQLIAYLRGEIKAGTLRVGEYLPSEVELGKRFGLSKESVRRALDVLVEDGLIVKIRRVGNRVTKSEIDRNGDEDGTVASHFPNSDEYTELRLAHYPSVSDEGRMQQAIASFEQSNPDIRVKLIPTSFPLEFAEHGIADVITLSAWDALKLKEMDASETLLTGMPDQPFAHPRLTAAFQSREGKLVASPFVYSPVVLCYNRDHFAECQIEEPHEAWTWYTLLKHAKLLHKQLQVRGFVAHIQSVNRWPVFLLQNGFRFKAEAPQQAAEDPALWESLRISRDLVYQQGAPILWTESDSDVERWFREGRASMILTSFYGMNSLMNTDLNYGVAPLPSLRTQDTLLLVTGLAIHERSPRQQAARRLVQHLCGLNVQTDIRQNTLTLPVHPEALQMSTGLAGNRPHGEGTVSQQWDRARMYSDLNMSAAVLLAIREELKAYWSRVEDEAEASERLEMLLGL